MSPTIESLHGGSVSHRAESVLRRMILGGQFAPGERLNEVALAEQLGISRGPLREAIQRLSGEGLLQLLSRRGAYVRDFTDEEVIHLYECRAAIELHAVHLIGTRPSDADPSGLSVLLEETRQALEHDYASSHLSELNFHHHLVELAGNPFLTKMEIEIGHQLTLVRSLAAADPHRAKCAEHEHIEILAALSQGDTEKAAKSVRQHLDLSQNYALARLRSESQAR